MPERIALVTGATGCVGSALVPALLQAGFSVRAASRRARPRSGEAQWVQLDVANRHSVTLALRGCDTAYYLVHALVGAARDYHKQEVDHAQAFREEAAAAGVRRIVYLGGLAPTGPTSRHLASRLAVGNELRRGSVQCVELRASMIVAGASASFQMLRDLAARLPAMVLPAWLETRTEPVALTDVVAALVAAADVAVQESRVFDLQGPEVMTCREIILRTAAALGVSPKTMRTRVLSPRASSWWIRFVSGVDVGLARELVDGLASDLLATHLGFRELANLPPPMPFDDAVRLALRDTKTRHRFAQAWEQAVMRLAPART